MYASRAMLDKQQQMLRRCVLLASSDSTATMRLRRNTGVVHAEKGKWQTMLLNPASIVFQASIKNLLLHRHTTVSIAQLATINS